MSSTNRGAERQETDAYFTPPALACLIVRTVAPMAPPGFALEPGCGEGAFLDALKAEGRGALGVEIVPAFADAARAKGHTVADGDFLTWAGEAPALVIGNPPFRLAEPFIGHSLQILRPGGILAFLVRLNFLGGQARFKSLWHSRPPLRVLLLPARPSFTADGSTDSIEYAVCVWVKGDSGPTILEWLDNTPISNRVQP